MSFIDNLRDLFNNIGVESDASTTKEKHVEPSHRDVMEEHKSNQYPSDWSRTTYYIAKPKYDDNGNEIGFEGDSDNKLVFYYDSDGALAGADSPMQSYDFSIMSNDDAVSVYNNLIHDYSRGGRFGTILVNGKSERNKGERHYRS